MKHLSTLKQKLTFAFAVFFALFMVNLLDAYRDSYKEDQLAINKMESLIKENCDCEDVSIDIYSKGIQFDKKGNFSTEKVEYALKNCRYISINTEAEKINSILKSQIKDYEEFDSIELNFISNTKHETVTINNGKIK